MLYPVHPVAQLFKDEFYQPGLADEIDDEYFPHVLWGVNILNAIREVKEFDGKFISFNILPSNFLDYLF